MKIDKGCPVKTLWNADALKQTIPRIGYALRRWLSSPQGTWCFLGLLATLLVWRKPWALQTPQLWAEDGIVFHQAREFGAAAYGFELAGYFQLTPRLIAALALLPDPRWVPHVFVGCAFAFTLYISQRAFASRCPLPFGHACAAAVVLAPDASEVLLVAANLQWIFALGFILLLVSRNGTTMWQHAHDLAATVLFGLTGPFCILFAPLFAWRAFSRRTYASGALAAIVTVCALVQAASILRHPQAVHLGAAIDWHALTAFAGIRVLGGLLLGHLLPPNLPWTIGICLTALLLAAIAVLAARRGAHRLQRICIGIAFAALLAATIFRCWHSMPVLCQPGAADRYVFPLEVVSVWLLLAWAGDGSGTARRLGFGLIVVMLAVNLPRLRVSPLPDRHWADYAPKLRAGEAVTIPINPGWELPFSERKSR